MTKAALYFLEVITLGIITKLADVCQIAVRNVFHLVLEGVYVSVEESNGHERVVSVLIDQLSRPDNEKQQSIITSGKASI